MVLSLPPLNLSFTIKVGLEISLLWNVSLCWSQSGLREDFGPVETRLLDHSFGYRKLAL